MFRARSVTTVTPILAAPTDLPPAFSATSLDFEDGLAMTDRRLAEKEQEPQSQSPAATSV